MIRLTDVTFVQIHVQNASLGKISPLTVILTATQISLSYLLLSLDLHSPDALSPSSLPPKAFSICKYPLTYYREFFPGHPLQKLLFSLWTVI